MTNRLRELFASYPGLDEFMTAVELLTAMRQWCDAEDIPFRDLVEASHCRYLEELAETAYRCQAA